MGTAQPRNRKNSSIHFFPPPFTKAQVSEAETERRCERREKKLEESRRIKEK